MHHTKDRHKVRLCLLDFSVSGGETLNRQVFNSILVCQSRMVLGERLHIPQLVEPSLLLNLVGSSVCVRRGRLCKVSSKEAVRLSVLGLRKRPEAPREAGPEKLEQRSTHTCFGQLSSMAVNAGRDRQGIERFMYRHCQA
jgi:hypothetical protein